jgi:hypothetical protein
MVGKKNCGAMSVDGPDPLFVAVQRCGRYRGTPDGRGTHRGT